MVTEEQPVERLPENRKRVRLQLTVHPKTDARLGLLAERFASNKGRIVDKLVECLAAAYSVHKQYCITGKPCKVDLTDLPDVF
jgi:hypothetical protein